MCRPSQPPAHTAHAHPSAHVLQHTAALCFLFVVPLDCTTCAQSPAPQGQVGGCDRHTLNTHLQTHTSTKLHTNLSTNTSTHTHRTPTASAPSTGVTPRAAPTPPLTSPPRASCRRRWAAQSSGASWTHRYGCGLGGGCREGAGFRGVLSKTGERRQVAPGCWRCSGEENSVGVCVDVLLDQPPV